MKKRWKTAAILAASVLGVLTPFSAEAGGWKAEGSGWIYMTDNGQPQNGGFTPDGYWVDSQGYWDKRTVKILDDTYQVPDVFQTSMRADDLLGDLNTLNKRIQAATNGIRVFHIYSGTIRYCRVDNGKETELLTLLLPGGQKSYQLRLSMELGSRGGSTRSVSTYDYAVFYLLLSRISHTPEMLADAICENWQGGNAYGLSLSGETLVGDTKVGVSAENGAGVYTLRSGLEN